jgi:hypothetical protein
MIAMEKKRYYRGAKKDENAWRQGLRVVVNSGGDA